jgi:hypothetical protein
LTRRLICSALLFVKKTHPSFVHASPTAAEKRYYARPEAHSVTFLLSRLAVDSLLYLAAAWRA